MTTVTLTTDFGTADGYVGAMKGVIVAIEPRAAVVDLTHEIPTQDVNAAAYALYRAVPYWPVAWLNRPVRITDRLGLQLAVVQ